MKISSQYYSFPSFIDFIWTRIAAPSKLVIYLSSFCWGRINNVLFILPLEWLGKINFHSPPPPTKINDQENKKCFVCSFTLWPACSFTWLGKIKFYLPSLQIGRSFIFSPQKTVVKTFFLYLVFHAWSIVGGWTKCERADKTTFYFHIRFHGTGNKVFYFLSPKTGREYRKFFIFSFTW